MRLMQALMDAPSIALVGVGLLGLICGWVLRHGWGIRVDRANGARIAVLCDQLDLKDATLQSLRAELHAEQGRIAALQFELEARDASGGLSNIGLASWDETTPSIDLPPVADDALQLENNEDRAFVERRIRTLQSRSALPQLL